MTTYDSPPVVAELEQLMGQPATLKLVEAHGGTRVFVPKAVGPDDPLAKLLGQGAAAALCGAMGGTALHVPRCASTLRAERDREIRKAFDEGTSAASLAREHQVTERTIWRILATADAPVKPKIDPRQRSLF